MIALVVAVVKCVDDPCVVLRDVSRVVCCGWHGNASKDALVM